mmetsp:Transcript_1204/g.2504  ORF Transcript_1204/g.2504 Transcript_1204/m.2504 type:complete len:325 (+) Transcript_1204:225-1199(+)
MKRNRDICHFHILRSPIVDRIGIGTAVDGIFRRRIIPNETLNRTQGWIGRCIRGRIGRRTRHRIRRRIRRRTRFRIRRRIRGPRRRRSRLHHRRHGRSRRRRRRRRSPLRSIDLPSHHSILSIVADQEHPLLRHLQHRSGNRIPQNILRPLLGHSLQSQILRVVLPRPRPSVPILLVIGLVVRIPNLHSIVIRGGISGQTPSVLKTEELKVRIARPEDNAGGAALRFAVGGRRGLPYEDVVDVVGEAVVGVDAEFVRWIGVEVVGVGGVGRGVAEVAAGGALLSRSEGGGGARPLHGIGLQTSCNAVIVFVVVASIACLWPPSR